MSKNGEHAKESKQFLEVRLTLDRDQMIARVEEVLAALKAGTLCVTSGSRSVVLKPAPKADFEMELSRKKDKESLKLSLSWRHEKPKAEVEEAPTFSVSCTEPPPKPDEVENLEPAAPEESAS